jgi:hypothetical protein
LDTTDAFFWIPPEFDKALNYNEVKRILLENVPSTEGIQFKWEKLEVFPLKENVATYHGIVLSSMPIDSAKMHQSRILESGTLIKRKDGWKLLSGQSINLKN